MRRLFALLLAVGLLGLCQGCHNCIHGRCDCVDRYGQPLELGKDHPADLAPAPPVQTPVEAPQHMPKAEPVVLKIDAQS